MISFCVYLHTVIHAVERSHQEQHTILRTDSGNGHGTRHGYRRDVQLRTDIRKRFYAISIATPYRRYYALWRIFTDERPPLFIRTLADTFVMAAGKAMDLLKYCKVTLKWVDNTFSFLITNRLTTR